MEQENFKLETQNQFTSVTPLSKFLAMALFVLMPFFGGWIGYTYSPEKVVEVEKIIVKEVVDEVNENQVTEEELSPYEVRLKRIEILKSDQSLTIDNIYDFQAVLPFVERKDLYATARKYVTENSAEGMEFSLVFIWKKGDWVNFMVVSENEETDNAQLFMRKDGIQWVLEGFGTAFPNLYERHPELFED